MSRANAAPQPGVYTVGLAVTDSAGQQQVTTQSVEITE